MEDAASLCLYIQVCFVTFCHQIVCLFQVRVFTWWPGSSPLSENTQHTSRRPHQRGGEGWWFAGVSVDASPTSKANISIFNTAAWPANHECHCLQDKQAFGSHAWRWSASDGPSVTLLKRMFHFLASVASVAHYPRAALGQQDHWGARWGRSIRSLEDAMTGALRARWQREIRGFQASDGLWQGLDLNRPQFEWYRPAGGVSASSQVVLPLTMFGMNFLWEIKTSNIFTVYTLNRQ